MTVLTPASARAIIEEYFGRAATVHRTARGTRKEIRVQNGGDMFVFHYSPDTSKSSKKAADREIPFATTSMWDLEAYKPVDYHTRWGAVNCPDAPTEADLRSHLENAPEGTYRSLR